MNQSHTELAAHARWLADEAPPAKSLELVESWRLNAAQALRQCAAALESPERVQGEARLQQECDTIAELNHAQWLALGKASLLVAACNRLSAEAEEFDFDDGLGRGAQQAYWDEFESALEHAMEAVDASNQTTHRILTTPSPQAERVPLSDEQIERLEAACVRPVDANGWGFMDRKAFARAIERSHGIVTKESST